MKSLLSQVKTVVWAATAVCEAEVERSNRRIGGCWVKARGYKEAHVSGE
jgi:hypothetical protein